jgi:mycofactocin system glycosyltransferase
MRTLTLDQSVRRAGGGQVLIGGSPLILLRLTAAGARLVDRIAARRPVDSGPRSEALIDRLLDAGIVHPWHPPDCSDVRVSDVTVVVPTLAATRGALQAIADACSGAAAVIVVDDASPTAIGPVDGATVIRCDVNGGPGAARMAGLEHVVTPFVAFVDADVEVSPGWLEALLVHFADERVAAVAPRVTSPVNGQATPTRLDRYEAVRSSLDLGPSPARVRAGTRVGYVPSAAIVCRVDALRAVGGFDPALRFGEDVDLVWRLDEAGWRVRYEPAVIVHHRPRPTTVRWLQQRFSYGSSAAPLAKRHPGALAPVRVSGWSAASWATAMAGWPLIGPAIGIAIAATTTALLARKLRDVPDGPRQALRLAGLGHLYAGRSLAAGITRPWWPFAAAAALVSRRARRTVLLAILVPALLEWRADLGSDQPVLDPVTYIALHLLDDIAYGSGVMRGALRTRSLDALRPDFRSWPTTGARSPQPAGR